ncbi:MutS-related protein [Paludisphaera mucosa]|uniref:DNA mismatch repair protein MutS n=1 Tax=Paludisphaera mucosa TaxID=3030827 RepID=A0ABT6F681_9BACT|nr:DNA mismatch repair protein MutS [Paludisphaera mucosa]MDG3003032.1 DNA mismatch repair protein MutS [Paludisphaera mucosa]
MTAPRAAAPPPPDLHAEYSRRLALHEHARKRWDQVDARLADLRLVVFVLAAALAGYTYAYGQPSWWWLSVPAGAFVGLLLAHEPIHRRAVRSVRTIEFYKRGLARMEDRWAGTGVAGSNFLNLDHPYAADLDLFGSGSLFERLCTARTKAGEEALASWLLAPSTPDVLSRRHAAVVELRPRLDLREDLELLGADVRAGIDPAALASWGTTPRVFPNRPIRIVAALLATFGASALAYLIYKQDPPASLLFVLMLLIEGVFALWLAKRVDRVLAGVDERAHDLTLLSGLLDRLEREPLDAPLLRSLREALVTGGSPASRRIRSLGNLLHLLDSRDNQFFMPFALVLLWKTQLAMKIDAWRAANGPQVAGWLAATGDFEALSALAAYAAENPSDVFPEIVPGPALFDAAGLGHPLIARAECVTNDVTLGLETTALVVSGSNMSGKSTLLRAIGVATVMSLAGGPVRASRLRLSPLAVGATLRVQDSLQAGRSRFYAEITRVRQIVDVSCGRLPLLFLLDELFSGTNSHDRRVGAEAVIRGLLDRHAIGLVTTHDLALAEIVAGLGPRTLNVHFEDHFEDGVMRFDYRIHPGVVQHSNALALMRAVGLDV